MAGGALVEVSTSEVADDWDQRWREFHRPLVLDGGRLVVRPPWEAALGAEIELVIDPGQAFGTGAHATTRLCLELMLGLAGSGDAGEPARRGGSSISGAGRACWPSRPRGWAGSRWWRSTSIRWRWRRRGRTRA